MILRLTPIQSSVSGKRPYLSQLPFRPINFTDAADVAQLATIGWSRWSRPCWICTASWPHGHGAGADRAPAPDRRDRSAREADRLVYELYGLTAAEDGMEEAGR